MSSTPPPAAPDLAGDLVLIIPAGALVAIVSAAIWFVARRRRASSVTRDASDQRRNGDIVD